MLTQAKSRKLIQRDPTIIFDVLSEYVTDFVLNLVFLAVAFRGFISVLSIRFIRPQPPALAPVPSRSVNLHVISSKLKQAA